MSLSWARLLCICSGALALAACSRTPQPVHFFAEGRPPKLSDWQVVYPDGGNLVLNSGVVPYDLNTPLFSDYAHKLRTVWMPAGAAAKYSADASFDFPVGTIITKTFYYPLPQGAAHSSKSVARTYDQSRDFAGARKGAEALSLANVHLIETRVLVRRAGGWQAFPYVWNSSQTEAELARTGDVLPLELVSDDGAREAFNYVVPNENQCAGCHVVDLKTKAIAPIGTKARHLNRNYDFADGNENQLAHWTKVGYLAGAPEAASAPKNADWRDPKQPVEARARLSRCQLRSLSQRERSGEYDRTGSDGLCRERSPSGCVQAARRGRPRHGRSSIRHHPRETRGLDIAVPHAIERGWRDDAGAGAHHHAS